MFFVTSFFPATLQLLVGSWTSGFFGGNEVGERKGDNDDALSNDDCRDSNRNLLDSKTVSQLKILKIETSIDFMFN
jgi:hypothetical protein